MPTRSEKSVVTGISFGPAVKTTPFENWHTNIKSMQAICRSFNIQFYAILQPTLGVGRYKASRHEVKMLEEYDQNSINNISLACKNSTKVQEN